MAPHQATRSAGRLLIESAAELDRLKASNAELLNMLQRMVDETSDRQSRPCLLTLEQAGAAIKKATQP
jgi:hypothetical protein